MWCRALIPIPNLCPMAGATGKMTEPKLRSSLTPDKAVECSNLEISCKLLNC